MFQKLIVISASTIALTFGGAFSSAADMNSFDIKQLSYKVLQSINGESANLSESDTADLLKKAIAQLQGKLLVDVDNKQSADKAEAEKTEKPAQKEETADKQQEASAEKEEAVQKPQEPKQEDKAPVQKEEAEAQPEQPAEQPKAEEKPQAVERPNAGEQPKAEEQPKQEQAQSSALSQFELQVVELTNQERAKNGLQPLKVDNKLSEVAREKSRDMASNGYFDHNSPSYGSPFDMMKSFGISYRTAGENIAQGQKTPQEVVNAWMNSPGHRANILNGEFTHIGVGYVEQGNHWTQQFIGK
ncbi:CAP domain-containing protein [Oceanobacillus sp. FSL H7-0719]